MMEKMECRSPFTWIAIRDLASTTGDALQMQLGCPEALAADEWRCAFRLVKDGFGTTKFAYGVDGLQALVQAIAGLRSEVEAHDPPLSWLGGDPGDVGLPRFVPVYLGFEFSRKIEAMIEEEVRSFVEGARRMAADSR